MDAQNFYFSHFSALGVVSHLRFNSLLWFPQQNPGSTPELILIFLRTLKDVHPQQVSILFMMTFQVHDVENASQSQAVYSRVKQCIVGLYGKVRRVM